MIEFRYAKIRGEWPRKWADLREVRQEGFIVRSAFFYI